jgi:hypothetical protein
LGSLVKAKIIGRKRYTLVGEVEGQSRVDLSGGPVS